MDEICRVPLLEFEVQFFEVNSSWSAVIFLPLWPRSEPSLGSSSSNC